MFTFQFLSDEIHNYKYQKKKISFTSWKVKVVSTGATRENNSPDLKNFFLVVFGFGS